METLFAADIGGTKSELALFPLVADDCRPLVQKKYINGEFSQLEEIFTQFLAESNSIPLAASIAVAGIVAGESGQMTNFPWKIDCYRLKERFKFDKVSLINDMTAVCSSLPLLAPEELYTIQQGSSTAGDIKGVVAPGTGLGEGLLVDINGQLLAQGSEGGHTNFAPVDEEQLALLSWLQKREKEVNYEMLISGPGLGNLYDFCKEYHQLPESPQVIQSMVQARDRIPAIVNGAINTPHCRLCKHVLSLFLSILGSEAGNLALKIYARGGIYLGGGILPRLVDKVSFDGFLDSFLQKGQMSDLMKEIPVFLIKRRDAALIGAAEFGRRIFIEESSCVSHGR
jgi:glucokinase